MNQRDSSNVSTEGHGKVTSSRASLGTRGGSMVEYLLLVGILALGAIYGFKEAQKRETHVIAQQARIVKTLDPSAPGEVDFTDPDFGDDWIAPFCNIYGECTDQFQCFAAGTPVATENGFASIETIHEGDLLWARDEQTGEIGLRPVTKRFVTAAQEVIDLSFATFDGGETIRVTSGHPFWVTGRGWIGAGRLSTNEELWSPTGEPIHLALPPTAEVHYETVYNFEIAEYHTFFVGHHRMWVHNGGPRGGCQVPGTLAYAKKAGIVLGGSYNSIKQSRTDYNNAHGLKPSQGVGGEVHHMPPQSIWNNWTGPGPKPFSAYGGPSIWMENDDHALTQSNGKQPGSAKYIAKQAALVKAGDVCGAIQMDINDVRNVSKITSNNPNKYQAGIQQMVDYVRSQGYACPGLG